MSNSEVKRLVIQRGMDKDSADGVLYRDMSVLQLLKVNKLHLDEIESLRQQLAEANRRLAFQQSGEIPYSVFCGLCRYEKAGPAEEPCIDCEHDRATDTYTRFTPQFQSTVSDEFHIVARYLQDTGAYDIARRFGLIRQEFKRLAEANAVVSEGEAKTCKWEQWNGDYGGTYDTQCGHSWAFTDGDIADNKVKFCPYCGGKVDVVAEAEKERAE